MNAPGSYVVIFFDRFDEASLSVVSGPYDNHQDAQAAAARALEKMGGYRRFAIEKCRSLSEIPEWERQS